MAQLGYKVEVVHYSSRDSHHGSVLAAFNHPDDAKTFALTKAAKVTSAFVLLVIGPENNAIAAYEGSGILKETENV